MEVCGRGGVGHSARALLTGGRDFDYLIVETSSLAESRLNLGAGDADFYRAKIATARFYAEHILPQSVALSSEVVNGAASVLALTEAQF